MMRLELETAKAINNLQPFDVEHSIEFTGEIPENHSSQKRDLSAKNVREKVDLKCLDLAKHSVLPSIKKFDRGVRWEHERLQILGQKWLTIDLPVWMYSYYETDKNKMHYVAVNGRTNKVAGSIPLNFKKLSLFTGLLSILAMALVYFIGDYFKVKVFSPEGFVMLSSAAIIVGAGFFLSILQKYSNHDSRFEYEKHASVFIDGLVKSEKFSHKLNKTIEKQMSNCNQDEVLGDDLDKSLDSLEYALGLGGEYK